MRPLPLPSLQKKKTAPEPPAKLPPSPCHDPASGIPQHADPADMELILLNREEIQIGKRKQNRLKKKLTSS
jgi:hypothetical protein